MRKTSKLTDEDYWRLLSFRTAVRRFLNYSKIQARQVDLTPTQHQLLLTIRGHRGNSPPTVGDVAASLLIKHHSAVELIDRAEAAGLVQRRSDPHDHRAVRLTVTRVGARKLERISAANLAELAHLGPELRRVWKAIERLSRVSDTREDR